MCNFGRRRNEEPVVQEEMWFKEKVNARRTDGQRPITIASAKVS